MIIIFSNKTLSKYIKEISITIAILTAATVAGYVLSLLQDNHLNITMIYLLGVVLIARTTTSHIYGIIASLLSIFCVNYLFTYPYFAFNFTENGYPLMFVSMFVLSMLTNALTVEMKKQANIAQLNEQETKRLYEKTQKLEIEAAKEKLRTDLFRAVSHDLRTPLTTIVGASSAILENKDVLSDDEKLKLIANINEDADWLIRMVENLLSVTRVSDGIAKLNMQEEVVEEIVAEALTKVKKHYPDAKIKVKVPDELLMASMDATLIAQVIINLIENAIQHSGSDDISFNVYREHSEIIFEVADKGKGIAEEDMPHLFEECFTSSENKSDSSKNMGIGLSVCMSIIKAHGGTLTVENAPDCGAIFRFSLKGN